MLQGAPLHHEPLDAHLVGWGSLDYHWFRRASFRRWHRHWQTRRTSPCTWRWNGCCAPTSSQMRSATQFRSQSRLMLWGSHPSSSMCQRLCTLSVICSNVRFSPETLRFMTSTDQREFPLATPGRTLVIPTQMVYQGSVRQHLLFSRGLRSITL
jgi:hypothetical protein